MKKLFLILFIIFSFISIPYTFAGNLKTEEAKKEDVTGMFKLILYGGRDMNDIERLAILDIEGDRYTFQPQAPDFDFRIKEGVSGEDAFKEAYKFISSHNAFHYAQLTKILDFSGNIIGFELRPLYIPFVFGVSNVLEVYYSLKDGKVKAFIKIIPSVERALPERTLVSFLKP
ncbi:MAG: hypothetical protein HXY47_08635 [Nitrospirae bacterium]|nr:hypothetical protein [Nitrospirota bacterium]